MARHRGGRDPNCEEHPRFVARERRATFRVAEPVDGQLCGCRFEMAESSDAAAACKAARRQLSTFNFQVSTATLHLCPLKSPLSFPSSTKRTTSCRWRAKWPKPSIKRGGPMRSSSLTTRVGTERGNESR